MYIYSHVTPNRIPGWKYTIFGIAHRLLNYIFKFQGAVVRDDSYSFIQLTTRDKFTQIQFRYDASIITNRKIICQNLVLNAFLNMQTSLLRKDI